MAKPTISIIIPVYNEERHLAACLDAIAAQTVAPDEVLVVDNNSTDSTLRIARKYPFVTVLHEPRQGTVYARNHGFSAATADWLVRIDADTQLPQRWTARFVELIDNHTTATAVTSTGKYYDVAHGGFFGLMQFVGYQLLQWPAMRGWTLWGANMAIQREAWETTKPHCHERTDIDEDVDLTLALKRIKGRVLFSTKLSAAMALKRDRSLLQTIRYVTTWPKDYWVNRQFGGAIYITFAMTVIIVFACITWPIEKLLHGK